MEKLEAKLATMEKALLTLEEVVHSWDKAIGQREEKMLRLDPFAEEDRLLTYLRDSLVKRFEYCADYWWKLLALYLETKGLGLPEIKAPKPIVRYCTQINFLSEMEGCIAFEMINSRNQTSHMYKQEIAAIIAAAVPQYYELMAATTRRMAH